MINLLNNFSNENVVTFLHVFGNVKLIVTALKYPPQIFYNYKRQSTEGWSIAYSWLDSIGGCFSVLQMSVLYLMSNDWTVFSGNYPKVGLGVLSLVCNGMLLFQHYVLYKRMNEKSVG